MVIHMWESSSVTCGWFTVLSRHSGFLHHLKLTFPTSLFTPSIVSLLYGQILSMHVKSPKTEHNCPTYLTLGVEFCVYGSF